MVGDCVLSGGEQCEDCNVLSSDGCNGLGQIEPGWICDMPGTLCKHVSGIATAPAQATAEVGSAGAQPPFEDPCPPGAVLVGLQATDTGTWNAARYLTYVATHCAWPEVDTQGQFHWNGPPVVGNTLGGSCCVSDGTPYPPIDCAPDTFVVGFHAWAAEGVSTTTLLCAPMSFDGQSVVVGAVSEAVGPMGSLYGIEQPDIACAGNQVATAILGSVGAMLDRFGLRCSAAVPTLCGDGALNGAEQCDDTNSVNGDGCSSLCKTE
jgi:cysteine-rich repeat protein